MVRQQNGRQHQNGPGNERDGKFQTDLQGHKSCHLEPVFSQILQNLQPMSLFADAYDPVSYTHLDVYKRQPLYDMGPYYFTALAALLGPVKRVSAFSGTGFPVRRIYAGPLKGQEIQVETPTHYSGTAELASGVIVSMNISFDIWHSNLPMFEIYGTEGTLEVPDPNMSGGRPKVYRKERTLDVLYDDSEDCLLYTSRCV